MNIFHKLVVPALLLSACIGSSPSETPGILEAQRVSTLCGGGFTSATKAVLAANIDEAKKSGEISAGIEDQFKAAILDNPGVTENSLPQIYPEFLSCVEKQTGL